MFLTRLELSGFRNLAEQSVSFKRPLTVISGRNGQGKTSILEAVYLLSHNRSFRSGKLKDVLQWSGRGKALIRATLRSEVGDRELSIEIGATGRRVTINGKSLATFAEFFGQAQVVAFTPETLQLVKGPPQQRRGFLDRILAMVDPVFVESAMHYHRAVKQRNALLHTSAAHDTAQVELWDSLLVRHGLEVAKKRAELVRFLSLSVPDHYRHIAADSEEHMSLSYSSDFLGEGAIARTEGELLSLLKDRIARDQRIKSTSFGVHHDDLELEQHLNDERHNARTASSQGQARSMALALNFAAIDFLEQRTGESPIVLLDDVESELDRSRRDALIGGILKRGYQVLITTTDADPTLMDRASTGEHFSIDRGIITSSSAAEL